MLFSLRLELRGLRRGRCFNIQRLSQDLTQARQVPIALDLAEPRLDVQQRGGQPALPLMRHVGLEALYRKPQMTQRPLPQGLL